MSRSSFCLLLLCGSYLGPALAAEPPACAGLAAAALKPGAELRNDGFDGLTLRGSGADRPIQLSNGGHVFNDLDLATIAESQKDGAHMQLLWTKSRDPAAACTQAVEPVKPALTSTTEGISLGDCVAQGRDYRAGLRKLRHKERSPDGFSLVLFCGDAGAYSIGDHWPAVGDPIYVALYDNGSIANVRFEPDCAAEQVAPRGNLSGSFNIKGVQSDTGYKVIPDLGSDTDPGLAWRCYNTDVEVVLYGQAPGKSKPEAVTRFTLKQAQRYHFTTQMGVLFTRDVEHQYVVSAASTIRDEGPVGTGPHYYASVVLYALPRQLETLFGGSYSGRDILHENEFADRLGLLFGVGLSEPSRELVAGLSFELLTGVNVTGAARWARFRQLDGVQVGDAFTGTSDSIPRQDRWQTSFVAGVALDLRYVTALFNRQ